jgi:hypothetical protein
LSKTCDTAENIRKELKKEWSEMWNNKYDDKRNAEGESTKKYDTLYVEEGQVIYAPRKCAPLDFNQILEKNMGKNRENKIAPHPSTGGWRKFSKDFFPAKRTKRERPSFKKDPSQQQRKSGRGWLNQIKILNA